MVDGHADADADRKETGPQAGDDPAARRVAARKERSTREGGGEKTGLGLTRSADSDAAGRETTRTEPPIYLNRNLWLLLAGVGLAVIMLVAFMIPAGGSGSEARSAPAWAVWVLLLSAVIVLGYVIVAERETRGGGLVTPPMGRRVSITERDAAALRESSGVLASGLALDETLDVILAAAVGLLEATEGSIMLLDTDREHLETICYRGDPGRYEPFARVALGVGIAGKVAESRKGIAISGPADPGEFEGLVEKKTAIDSAICVPLIARSKLIGVLSVSDTVGGRGFDSDDLVTLEVFANDAAAAIVHSAGVR